MEVRKAATDCSGLLSRCFWDFLYLPKADKCCLRVLRSRVCLLRFLKGWSAGRGSLCKSLSPGNKLTGEANDLAPESQWVLCQELR